MLTRKLLSAFITGALFAIILGFVMPNPFEEQVVSEDPYLYTAVTVINVYLMYSLPVILVYGIVTSIISDKIANWINKRNPSKKRYMFVSGAFHILFGLILIPYSLGASLLFFITDKWLESRKEPLRTSYEIFIFLTPLIVWVISIGTAWIVEM